MGQKGMWWWFYTGTAQSLLSCKGAMRPCDLACAEACLACCQAQNQSCCSSLLLPQFFTAELVDTPNANTDGTGTDNGTQALMPAFGQTQAQTRRVIWGPATQLNRELHVFGDVLKWLVPTDVRFQVGSASKLKSQPIASLPWKPGAGGNGQKLLRNVTAQPASVDLLISYFRAPVPPPDNNYLSSHNQQSSNYNDGTHYVLVQNTVHSHGANAGDTSATITLDFKQGGPTEVQVTQLTLKRETSASASGAAGAEWVPRSVVDGRVQVQVEAGAGVLIAFYTLEGS